MGNADLKRSAVPICLHFEAPFAVTGIKRGDLYAYILAHSRPKPDTLLDTMEREYFVLQQPGAVIDEALSVLKR